MMLKLPLWLLIVWLQCQSSEAGDRVKLIDITAITLYKGRMTTGRRNSPIPQMSCVGGSAGCGTYAPDVVQCYNRGNDGVDVQWECKSEMPDEYKFGRIEVLCEGYDFPDDPYILRGSCGLEYTIDSTGKGAEAGYGYKPLKKTSYAANILFWIIVGLFLLFLYRTCFAPATRMPGRSGGGSGGGGGGGFDGGPPPPPGFRPNTYPDDSCHQNYQGASSSGTAGAGPGFWTGMGAGGLLGYLFGNRGGNYGGYGGYRRDYYDTPGPSYGRSSGGFSSSGFGSGGGGGSHSSSGFGGTRRR